MKKTKRLLGIFLATTMFAALISPLTVFAWSDGDNGDALTTPKTIDGTLGGVSEEATINVKGTIGATSNTDPEAPIPEGDAGWINVTIPTNMVFAANNSTTGAIISPKYTITNNSGRGVKVNAKEFAVDGVEPAGINGSEIKLLVARVGSVAGSSTVDAASTNLRNTDDTRLGTKTLIATLQSQYKSGDTSTTHEKGKVTLQFAGTIATGAFPATGSVNAKYKLKLEFEALTLAQGW